MSETVRLEFTDPVFELKSEASDGAKLYDIRAISVTITGNKREYTKKELEFAGRSLSFRPLNINHDHSKFLPYPESQTLEMDFDPIKNAVTGQMIIHDEYVNQQIKSGKIKKLSIEQIPTRGETCNLQKCTQHGIVFTAMALLTEEKIAGDSTTEIKEKMESTHQYHCDDCGKIFKTKKDLDDHYDDDHSTNDESKSSVNHIMDSQNQTMSANTETKPTTEAVDKTEVKAEPQPIVSLTKDQFESIIKSQSEQLKAVTEALGIIAKKDEAKTESSSEVDTALAQKTNYESTVVKPAQFFESVKNGTEGNIDSVSWSVNKEEILEKSGNLLRQKTINYSTQGSSPKGEAVTITGGDMPQVFSKQVLLIKGGRMTVPLRQFCDVQEITSADRVNWYTITGFDVDDTTSEGTEPTNKTQTVAKIQAVPALKRAVQTVNYSDIENAPFDLVEAVNQASVLGSIGVENTDIINTVPDAVAPDNSDLVKMAWIRADTGANIANDDAGTNNIGASDPKFLTRALEVLENRGHDTSAGNVVAVLHPQTIRELLDAISDKYYAQEGSITMRSLGVLERRFGVEIVASNKVKFVDNSTNTDVYRNYVFIKGAIGLGVAKNLQLEAQKKVELSAIKVSARFRMKSAIIDASQIVRVSSKGT